MGPPNHKIDTTILYKKGQVSKSINFTTHPSKTWHKASNSPKRQRLKTMSTLADKVNGNIRKHAGGKSEITRRYGMNHNNIPILDRANLEFGQLFPKQ